MIYCTANNLKISFSQCSTSVKNVILCSYCLQFYSNQLWYNYLKSSYCWIKVACNDAFRLLHTFPCSTSARNFQVYHNIITFDALLQKCTGCQESSRS